MQAGVIVYRPTQEEVRLYIDALRELPPEVVGPMLPGVEFPALSSGIEEPEVVVLEPDPAALDRTAIAREVPVEDPRGRRVLAGELR
jgi:hypothetical protein